MKLWLIDSTERGCERLYVDDFRAFVIRAETEEEARQIAASEAERLRCDSRDGLWLDPELATCVEVSADGEPGVVLSDYYEA